MEASAYLAGDGDGAGIMRQRVYLQYAVLQRLDPDVIPLGTRLFIPGYGGSYCRYRRCHCG